MPAQEAEALAASGAQHLQERFLQALALGQLLVAWPAAALLGQADAWRDLGDAALQALDVELAIRWPHKSYEESLTPSNDCT